MHNTSSDCWVSFFGEVYDLSKLIQDNFGAECEPIIKFAGQDITNWFDPKTKEVMNFLFIYLASYMGCFKDKHDLVLLSIWKISSYSTH